MRHALYAPPFGTFGDVTVLVELAKAAEQAAGTGSSCETIWCTNTTCRSRRLDRAPAIASATTRACLGPLVTPLPRRRPWKVARDSVTLDHLSDGRLVLGIGLGIDFWREFAEFGDDRARPELLDDGIEIIDRLRSTETVTFSGARLSVDGVRFLPAPRQRPRIPIWSAMLWPPRPGPLRRAARCGARPAATASCRSGPTGR